MAKIIRGIADTQLDEVRNVLELYERDHTTADAQLYRQNDASIRIRIIDDRFAEMPRSARHQNAWQYLNDLDPDILEQITLFLLLPTSELGTSMMNIEFEHPLASAI